MLVPTTEHEVAHGYNGWTNYETWCVHLWLTNDEASYRKVSALAHRQSDSYQIAERIKRFVEEMNPLIDEANLFSDLLNAALREVNWDEIADTFVDVD